MKISRCQSLILGAMATLLPVSLLFAQSSALSMGTQSVLPDDTAEVSLQLDNSEPLEAFQLGVCHDATFLTVITVDPGVDLLILGTPSFFDIVLYPNGFTAGVLPSVLGSGFIPVGSDQEILSVTYEANAVLGATPLEICASLGVPPVDVLTYPAGNPVPEVPFQNNGTMTISPAGFLRGDSDSSGDISLHDVLQILQFLFFQLSVDCIEALDVTGNSQIGMTDPIHLISYLFLGSAPPVGPFPDCGPPTTTLGCATLGACP